MEVLNVDIPYGLCMRSPKTNFKRIFKHIFHFLVEWNMPLRISYKDDFNGTEFRATKDFTNHHIFRYKCWGCHFFNMDVVRFSPPYGLIAGGSKLTFCLLRHQTHHISSIMECPDFYQQFCEEYIPIIVLKNNLHIIL